MTRKRNYKKLLYPLLTLFLLVVSIIGGQGVLSASAATTVYASPLEDLQKDESFDVSEYPVIEDDYSLTVIQIAESEQGELLIYVYQPAANQGITASSINIAREMDNSAGLGFKNYFLEYQSSSGVFFKYKVKNFELRADAVRYYNISNILRPFISGIDEPSETGQSISEVPNKVAQFWTACTVNNAVTYTVVASKVIEITQKVVGYCNYDDGLQLDWGAMQGVTKAYFVAFDTNLPIDKLISVDISFWAQKAKFKVCGNQANHNHDYLYDMHDVETACYGVDNDFGENTVHYPPLTLEYTQKFSNVGGGNWFGRPANNYTWNRIRKTEDFISDNINKDYILTDGSSEQLSGTKWVLNFYEAHDKYFYNNVWFSFIPGVTKIPGVADGEAQFEFVNDVMLLRLEFETDGERYNLGVVDNKQTGNRQFNEYTGWDFWQWLADLMHVPRWAAIAIFWSVIALVVLAILAPILSLIFPIVGQVLKLALNGIWIVIKYLFIGLWWLICLPFKVIAALVRKKREQPEQEELDEPTKRSSKPKPKKSSKPKSEKDNKKKPPRRKGNRAKNESAVGKLYKTTDGVLGGKPHIKKPRTVVATEQRKGDGAVAVVKIHKKKGKEEKIGKDFIPELELSPDDHSALTEPSIVSRQVIFGFKDGDEFKPLYVRDFAETGDMLSKKELRIIHKEVHNTLEKHRRSYDKKKRKWKRRKF